ncbi:MAG: hypothetical protein Kow00129_15000 [Thermoleophilia bacterium]
MFQYQHNAPVDLSELAELFSRQGWEEKDAPTKLEWIIATSEDWVVCTIDDELIAFGRTFRLDPGTRLIFDVVVDTRFEGYGLDDEIKRLLVDAGEGRVAVFRAEAADRRAQPPVGYEVPEVPPGAYTGRDSDE